MTAPSRPPHLVCCYVGVAFSNMYAQSAYQGGVFRKSLLEDWLTQNKFSPKNLELIRAHPNYDDFWKAIDPETVASRVNVPTMFLGGWYDIFTAGSINSFVTINKQGDVGARGKCRLVMEPYGHGRSEDLVFPNANHPKAADMWGWFDLWMKNDGKGIEQIPAVQYFVMGDPADPNTPGNKWRTADDWPVPATPVKVYFHTDKKLRLEPPQEVFGSLAYKYDPKNPVPTIGGANLTITKGPKDQRPVEDRPDVLLFTSPALDRYVEITGPVKVQLLGLLDRQGHRLHGQALRRLPRWPKHHRPRRHPPGQPPQLHGKERADGARQDLRDGDRPVVHQPGRQPGPPRPRRDLVQQLAPLRAQPEHGETLRHR